jgi:hypothetical protein
LTTRFVPTPTPQNKRKPTKTFDVTPKKIKTYEKRNVFNHYRNPQWAMTITYQLPFGRKPKGEGFFVSKN